MSAITTTIYVVQYRATASDRHGWTDFATHSTQADADDQLVGLMSSDHDDVWNGLLRVVERTTTITQTVVTNVRGVGE
jgi:hypothetical protein